MSKSSPIQEMMNSHARISARLALFTHSLQAIEEQRARGFFYEKQNVRLMFEFMETEVALHAQEEEALLSKLRPKLKVGSSNDQQLTASVGSIEEEHRMLAEVVTRMKTIISLIESQAESSDVSILLDELVQKGRWVVQAYQRHIWREDNIIFPAAEELLSAEEFREVETLIGDLRKESGGSV